MEQLYACPAQTGPGRVLNFDSEKCVGCNFCVEVCPLDIIDPISMVVNDPAGCIGCRACTAACPDNARHYPAPVEARIAELMAAIHEKNPAHKAPAVFL